VKRSYHIEDSEGKRIERVEELTRVLSRNGQALVPLLELVTDCRGAVDEIIDVAGRAAIQAVLELSAQEETGEALRQPGKKRAGDIVRWGRQAGRVSLSDRKLRVSKPRLRSRSGEEVAVPVYEAMQRDDRLGERMLEILLSGVSTRRYEGVISEMADTAGVSKSSVSRETIEASGKALGELLERRFEEKDLIIVYVDGLRFGEQTVIGAVGVHRAGRKHVLGLQPGATENAAAAEDLLAGLVERGLSPEKKRLFVIDGSKALRTAIRKVFGSAPVQRCRAHKLRNVLERLPEDQRQQAQAALRAAWKLDAKQGLAQLAKLAEWYERDWPAAAAALREGAEECFTINRLGVPPSLWRCLATTNIIESPNAGVRLRTTRITRWQDADMVQRWVAASLLDAEKSFRKIMGYRDLWMLDAILNPASSSQQEAA
jgi:putative transposase